MYVKTSVCVSEYAWLRAYGCTRVGTYVCTHLFVYMHDVLLHKRESNVGSIQPRAPDSRRADSHRLVAQKSYSNAVFQYC